MALKELPSSSFLKFLLSFEVVKSTKLLVQNIILFFLALGTSSFIVFTGPRVLSIVLYLQGTISPTGCKLHIDKILPLALKFVGCHRVQNRV